MKELLGVWGRVAGKTYSAVGRAEHAPGAPTQKPKTYNKRRTRLLTLLTLSVVALAAGLAVAIMHPYDLLFDWKVTFGDGGEIFEMWRKPEVDLYLRIYLFNITNADEFLAGKEPVKMEQVGPYVYKELFEHGNVTFNPNGTLSSIPIHPLQWQPHLSYPLTQEDQLVLPNIAMLSIGYLAASSNMFTRLAVNTLLRSSGSQPLLKMSAHDFMFGFSSNLVTLGNSLLPGWIKFDKLGLIDRMYDFESDFETVYTGEHGAPQLAGLLDTWRGERSLPHWRGSCGDIHMASDGAKFPGDLTGNEEILFYRKSLCRAAPMVKTGEGWMNGLWGYKYTFHKDALDNGLRDERNKCFCRKGECLPDGLIDVTDCYYGFPIALSYPHFLHGAPSLTHKVEGMEPSAELHSSAIWLQPRSGLPLSVAARFQINLFLDQKMSSIHALEPFSKMTLPLLWFEIRMFGLPERMANLFKLYLSILPTGEVVVTWVLLVASPVLLSIFFIYLRKTRETRTARGAYNPKRRSSSRYTGAIRKMSMDLEAKLQGVYAPCEIPLNGHESSAPFLNSDVNGSDSDEVEAQVTTDRRPSLIQMQTDKIKEMGMSFGSRMQENFEGISKNIRNLATRLSHEASPPDSDDANHNEGFSSESCQSGSEEGGFYKHVTSSDDEACHVEIVDDGSEFDAPFNADRRRQSVEFAKMEKRMTLLERGKNIPEEMHEIRLPK